MHKTEIWSNINNSYSGKFFENILVCSRNKMCIYSTKKQKSVVLYLYAKTATNWDNHLLRLLLQKICMISYKFFQLKNTFFYKLKKTQKQIFWQFSIHFCNFLSFYQLASKPLLSVCMIITIYLFQKQCYQLYIISK